MEIIIVILIILLAVSIRLIAGISDQGRVEKYCEKQGWKLLNKEWRPFGIGWFLERDSRIYEIKYQDQHGNIHSAGLKKSFFTGVYLSNDKITSQAPSKANEVIYSHKNECDINENIQQDGRIFELEEENCLLKKKSTFKKIITLLNDPSPK